LKRGGVREKWIRLRFEAKRANREPGEKGYGISGDDIIKRGGQVEVGLGQVNDAEGVDWGVY